MSEVPAARVTLDPNLLMPIYRALFEAIGPRHWWPGDGTLEIIVGAILTQNTSWKNVEKAIGNLKEKNCISLKALDEIPQEELAQLIRPSGYFNQKAKKIKIFVRYICNRYACSLKKMRQQPLEQLREELLGIHGIGPETADSILLYAFEKPTFVVDAYTRRILLRHGWMTDKATYEDIRAFFMRHLPEDVALFNEFHALFVYVGNQFCRKEPKCQECPLQPFLPEAVQSEKEPAKKRV